MESSIALFGLMLSVVMAAAGIIWKITRVETSLRADIAAAREDGDERHLKYERELNETLLAMRQKINDVELYASQQYLRRDGFYKVQEQMQDSMRDMMRQIDARFVRVEEKIDDIRKP